MMRLYKPKPIVISWCARTPEDQQLARGFKEWCKQQGMSSSYKVKDMIEHLLENP